MPATATSTSPSGFLRLVADPQRWGILEELGRSDRTVGELVELVAKPQNLVSYHLGELRAGGLVSRRRSSADRRDTYYRVNVPACAELLAKAGSDLHCGVRLRQVGPSSDAWSKAKGARVLFLCTGNSSRSQMAEAMLRHITAGAVDARSAGSHPRPLHANAVRVMAERGIDISSQTSKHLGRFTRVRFDRVITLCDKVREVCPEFPGGATAHWSMADPANDAASDGRSYASFVEVADELEWRTELLANQLLDEGGRS
jgi:protein-tyrosine-phosphatase/DNA-binding transcriptional ArsR family regulator